MPVTGAIPPAPAPWMAIPEPSPVGAVLEVVGSDAVPDSGVWASVVVDSSPILPSGSLEPQPMRARVPRARRAMRSFRMVILYWNYAYAKKLAKRFFFKVCCAIFLAGVHFENSF